MLSMLIVPWVKTRLILFLICSTKTRCFSSQQCFADEYENIFETTSWNTYLRYITTNRNLVYVLIFIAVVFIIEVNTIYISY